MLPIILINGFIQIPPFSVCLLIAPIRLQIPLV
nr:MAG TPA: hypothetical protein [Caudoviricetes sp.]